jgi:hypothetical protein
MLRASDSPLPFVKGSEITEKLSILHVLSAFLVRVTDKIAEIIVELTLHGLTPGPVKTPKLLCGSFGDAVRPEYLQVIQVYYEWLEGF